MNRDFVAWIGARVNPSTMYRDRRTSERKPDAASGARISDEGIPWVPDELHPIPTVDGGTFVEG